MRKFKKVKYPTYSDLLRPNEVRSTLEWLGITWDQKKVNSRGWVIISSPLREDKNPSFSLNVDKGCFKDFSTGEKGDIIRLVSRIKGYSIGITIQCLSEKFNIDYKASRVPYAIWL